MPSRLIRILQVTDCHILDDPADAIMGVVTHATLAAVVADIRARGLPANLVLATGDLSQTGSAASYRLLADQLDGLGAPVHCLAGNHDDPASLARYLTGDSIAHDAIIDLGGWRIVMLASRVDGSHGGRLAADQLDLLDDALAGAGDRFALLGECQISCVNECRGSNI